MLERGKAADSPLKCNEVAEGGDDGLGDRLCCFGGHNGGAQEEGFAFDQGEHGAASDAPSLRGLFSAALFGSGGMQAFMLASVPSCCT